MAVFEYKALDPNGKECKGTMEADNDRQIRQLLRDKQLTPITVVSVNHKNKLAHKRFSFFQRKSISITELATITRQLSTLIQASIPIEEALNAVALQQEKTRIRNLLLSIRSKILEGFTFTKSLENFPHIFPQIYIATVSAGEHAGKLDKVMVHLADYTEASLQSSRKIKQAMIYPMILMLTAFGVLFFLLGYIVPDVISIFIESGHQLPPLTNFVVAVSNFLKQYWLYLLSFFLVLMLSFANILSISKYRFMFDKLIICIPVIGKFSKSINTTSFARTLSILTRSSVPLVEAVTIAQKVINNSAIRLAVKNVAKKICEGTSLSASLMQTNYFPPLMIHMIISGEKTGNLDKILERVAKNQQDELDGQISILLSLFEPFMLILMGALVMLIVMAILMPIINMNELV